MGKATFFFHGLFPDHVEPDKQGVRRTCKVLFDAEFEGSFHSHLLAGLEALVGKDEAQVFEVRHDLHFECSGFSQAAVRYYQQVAGPQCAFISPSGPKGPNPDRSVYRVQWEISLETSRRITGPPRVQYSGHPAWPIYKKR